MPGAAPRALPEGVRLLTGLHARLNLGIGSALTAIHVVLATALPAH